MGSRKLSCQRALKPQPLVARLAVVSGHERSSCRHGAERSAQQIAGHLQRLYAELIGSVDRNVSTRDRLAVCCVIEFSLEAKWTGNVSCS